MTIPRKEQVALDTTPFYHCYVRCVRRAYLCGDDELTGMNYDHRKQWVVSRLKFLSYIYAIDLCAYAVMSNHYHVVLHVDKKRAEAWSDDEVFERWTQLYNAPVLVQRWQQNRETLDQVSLDKVSEVISEWRERLFDIGWFMRGVNETIARMANDEEKCKGRFWEGRYKSQALLDETAVLSCMAYVDLNPVRAGMADDVIESDFTSIQQRLFDYVKYKPRKNKDEKRLVKHVKQQQELKEELELNDLPEAKLMSLHGGSHTSIHAAIPFTREDYFQLVDETGRCIRGDKRGYISPSSNTLIASIGIDPNKWLEHVQHFGKTYSNAVGDAVSMEKYAQLREKKWNKGVGQANKVCLRV